MKPDSDEIKDFLTELSEQDWLGRVRSKWVNFSYHFSEISNAIEILKTGKIRCRADLENDSSLPVDMACVDIISQTDKEVKESVRLYFRPLTPTQFHMEGFRPISEISKNSHCRVPIFFLFDSREILCRSDSRFSEVNLSIFGTKDTLRSKASHLKAFNFRDIYHDGPFSSENRARIIAHRNAEIVVPRELDLSALRYIICRSEAEKETLIHLLPPDLIKKWGSRIYVGPNLYRRRWVFIETAMLFKQKADFMFSPDAEISEPFFAEVIIRSGMRSKTLQNKAFKGLDKVSVNFGEDFMQYEIEFLLDEHIAYAGKFDGRVDEIPF